MDNRIDLTEHRDFQKKTNLGIVTSSMVQDIRQVQSSLMSSTDEFEMLLGFESVFGKTIHNHNADIFNSKEPRFLKKISSYCYKCGAYLPPWKRFRGNLCKNCEDTFSFRNIPWNKRLMEESQRNNTMDVFNLK